MSVRHFSLVLHRWFGLVTAAFLIFVALTGSILALRPQLDRWLSPERFATPRPGVPQLDLATLLDRIQPLIPPDKVLDMVSIEPDRVRVGLVPPALTLSIDAIEQRLGMSMQEFQEQMKKLGLFARLSKMAEMRGKLRDVLPTQADLSTLYVDPWTGKQLARVDSGRDLMGLIYSLHYSLGLGGTGARVLGVIAVLWTLDCFVAFYLTLPVRRRAGTTVSASAPSWWARWKPAWLIKTNSGLYRLNLDLHRANGLWLWLMLFVFAWSSVMLNLPSVYTPVTKALFGYESAREINARRPKLNPNGGPPPSFTEILMTGQRLAADEGARRGMVVGEPIAVMTIPPALARVILRSADPACKAATDTDKCLVLEFASQTATVTSFRIGDERRYVGNDVSAWLHDLHVARPFGLAYQIFVFIIGLVITLLSVTGVYIWWKKRSVRKRSTARKTEARHTAEAYL